MSSPTVCFCSIAYRERPIAEIVPHLAAAGYDGIELWGGHLDPLDDAGIGALRAQADACGIALPVIAPYFWLTRDLPELLARSFATAERSVALARRLGATRIRTFVDAGPDGIGSAAAEPQHWRRAVDGLRRIAALAPDLLFVIETHANTLADTPASALRLLDLAGAANLALNYQTGHGDPLPGYRTLRHRIRHLHLHNRASPDGGYLEDGTSDLPGLLAALASDGYAGTLSVEYCWQGVPWGRAATARAWLARHLAQEPATLP